MEFGGIARLLGRRVFWLMTMDLFGVLGKLKTTTIFLDGNQARRMQRSQALPAVSNLLFSSLQTVYTDSVTCEKPNSVFLTKTSLPDSPRVQLYKLPAEKISPASSPAPAASKFT